MKGIPIRVTKIYLPHINHTVHVRNQKPRPDGLPSVAWTEKIDDWNTAIYLPKILMPPTVAHELIHVLQYISDAKGIDFVHEQEHFGYLMQYLLGKILGYEWKI